MEKAQQNAFLELRSTIHLGLVTFNTPPWKTILQP